MNQEPQFEEDVEMNGLKIREFKPPDYGPFSVIHDSLYPAHPFFLERKSTKTLASNVRGTR